jgi:hypothetical protein
MSCKSLESGEHFHAEHEPRVIFLFFFLLSSSPSHSRMNAKGDAKETLRNLY